MRRALILLALASALTGCASTIPICDGKDRRPINAPAHVGAFHQSCGTAA